jgi:hypothetical protein
MPLKVLAILVMFSFISSGWTNDNFAGSQRDEQGDEWNPVSAGPITTWTAPLCGKGKCVVQPFFFYNSTRGTFNPRGHFDSLPAADSKYQFQQQLFMQYGLTDRLEIDGQMVYQENYAKQGNLNAHSCGSGDSYLFLRYCAVEEKGWFPHLTGLLLLKAPTGKYQHADISNLGTDLMGAVSGGGSWDYGCGILLTKKLKPFLFHIDAIYSIPQEANVDGAEIIYGKYLNYDFGVEYFLSKGFNLIFEFNGFIQSDKKWQGKRVPDSDIRYLTIAPAIGWSNDKVQTLFAYQRTLSGTNTDANDSVVFIVVYTF